jgi:hypothetical protein
MGIVSFCPNKHRVKVKDELAGRKGICPTCGARFRIPLESQPEPAPPAPAPAAAPAAATAATLSPTGLPVAAIVSFDAGFAATLPRVLPFANVRHDGPGSPGPHGLNH